MQVSGPAQPSALEVWLQEIPSTEPDTGSANMPADSVAPARETDAALQRDSAEGLLDLDVWSANAGTRQLVATGTGPPATGSGAGGSGAAQTQAQAWAEYIFRPLV